jgi:hypothetical protein
MGQEVACIAKYGGKKSPGIAMLETDFLLFRGDFRVKIPFAAMQSIQSAGGWLTIASNEGSLTLELGPRAEKWASKILHPPSRLDKLGVKPGLRVRIIGARHTDLQNEVEQTGATISRTSADLIFFGAERTPDLDRIDKLTAAIPPDGAIWIIYPKGVRQITESEVIAAIRAAGLKDVKVASFSATHTALKAVIPLSQRTRQRRDQRAAR